MCSTRRKGADHGAQANTDAVLSLVIGDARIGRLKRRRAVAKAGPQL